MLLKILNNVMMVIILMMIYAEMTALSLQQQFYVVMEELIQDKFVILLVLSALIRAKLTAQHVATVNLTLDNNVMMIIILMVMVVMPFALLNVILCVQVHKDAQSAETVLLIFLKEKHVMMEITLMEMDAVVSAKPKYQLLVGMECKILMNSAMMEISLMEMVVAFYVINKLGSSAA